MRLLTTLVLLSTACAQALSTTTYLKVLPGADAFADLDLYSHLSGPVRTAHVTDSHSDGRVSTLSLNFDHAGHLLEATAKTNGQLDYRRQLTWQGERLLSFTNTTPKSSSTSYVRYDQQGRPIEVRNGSVSNRISYNSDGSQMTYEGMVATVFDQRGQVVRELKGDEIARWQACRSTCTNVGTQYTYDTRGRLQQVHSSDGQIMLYNSGKLAEVRLNSQSRGLKIVSNAVDRYGNATRLVVSEWKDGRYMPSTVTKQQLTYWSN